MTLKGHYALCLKTHAYFGANHENLNEDRPILSATLVSHNIRFMSLIVGFPGERASNDSGVVKNVDLTDNRFDFQSFRTPYLKS